MAGILFTGAPQGPSTINIRSPSKEKSADLEKSLSGLYEFTRLSD